jgi:predicted SprT family Zn-dependent metalloprotease
MTINHASCSHPRTPAGRAACRKAGGPAFTTNVAAGLTLRDPAEAKLADVRALALRLMAEFGVIGWRFCWDRSTKRFGECRHGMREIGISRALAAANPIEVTEDTIRHEIAHVLVGPGHRHNEVWKRMAVRVGARPDRYYDNTVVRPPAGSWTGVCPNGHRMVRYRLTERLKRSACTACCRTYNGGRFTSAYMFTWTRN